MSSSKLFSLAIFVLVFAALACETPASAAATETIIHNFNPNAYGVQPNGGLISDSAGNLYGVTAWGGTYDAGRVFELVYNSQGGWTEKDLYDFKGGSDLFYPSGTLTFDAAGNIYGATTWGGLGGLGGIYKLSPTSSGTWKETVLHIFTDSADGYSPNGGLVFDTAGNLYGTTTTQNSGTSVFKLTPDSKGHWSKTVIYRFAIDGYPNGNLIFDSAGNLYGTTTNREGTYYGAVFELAPSSGLWNETVLYTFTGGADGAYPQGGLTFDAAGNLYGAAASGGDSRGTIFKLTAGSNNSWTQEVLYTFQGETDGGSPLGNLVFDNAGDLYGVTSYGGTSVYAAGTVFQLAPSSTGEWIETQLWSFTGGADGWLPEAGVALRNGNVYAAASMFGTYQHGAVIELTPNQSGQWSEASVTDFPFADGGLPKVNLVSDALGNIFGATSVGGTNGCGIVFELTNANGVWNEKTLYEFKSEAISECEADSSALAIDSSGNLFGENSIGSHQHPGSIFELSPGAGGWIFKTIYVFNGEEGSRPFGGLIFDPAGNLYGTTKDGGSPGCGGAGCGTVFELSRSGETWTESVLHRFTGGSDGANPVAGLILDAAGNLYGATPYGGPVDNGTVFELSPGSAGWSEKILYGFTNTRGDGAQPMAGLAFDSAGNLYGTTSAGGYYGGGYCYGYGCGTVFELSPNSGGWNETVLLQFKQSDGSYPLSTPIFDSAGNLYATAEGGLGYVWGTVIELSPSAGGTWTETVLHNFGYPTTSGHDGYLPECGLIMDSVGNLYGTTIGGGEHNGGTVFEITR
jgi:uncharacterized repeat protein (TIGR03803 family)